MSPRDDLYAFFDTLCVEHGFCLSDGVIEEIVATKGISSDEFANAVLQAEGLESGPEGHWFRLIERLFRTRFGEAVVLPDP